MRFKLDECLDVRLSMHFTNAGYNAESVQQEGLSGASDQDLYSTCLREERTLVTQDLDFSNPFRFSPLPGPGIIVLRNPSQLLQDAEKLMKVVLKQFKSESPEGRLWVVTIRGIRIWPA